MRLRSGGCAVATLAALILCGLTVPVATGAPKWRESAVLQGSRQQDFWVFGRDIDLDGSAAIVGADGAGPGGPTARGEAYVFVREGERWVEEQRLDASDGEDGDRFGRAVAVEGDVAVVGASFAEVAGEILQGAAYVFLRAGGVWTEHQKLVASDGDSVDRFGESVAIEGDTIVVGAVNEEGGIEASRVGCQGTGAAYVFVRTAGSWVEQDKLFDPDGQCSDLYGSSVVLNEDTLLVAAPAANVDGAVQRGAVYAYREIAGRWAFEQRLLASDGRGVDEFGSGLALDRELALIGAEAKVIDGEVRHGAAYVFARRGSAWGEVQRLTPNDGQAEMHFGRSAALRGGVALLGAERDIGNENNQGVVFEFREVNGVWQEVQWFPAPMGNGLDSFGGAIALDDERALISNPGNVIFDPMGVAWIFARPTMFEDGFESGDSAAWDVAVEN